MDNTEVQKSNVTTRQVEDVSEPMDEISMLMYALLDGVAPEEKDIVQKAITFHEAEPGDTVNVGFTDIMNFVGLYKQYPEQSRLFIDIGTLLLNCMSLNDIFSNDEEDSDQESSDEESSESE